METEVRAAASSYIMQGFLGHDKDFRFYFKSNKEPLDGFEMGSKVI